MNTAIAIIALIGYVLGIIHDIYLDTNPNSNKINLNSRIFLATIMILSWWTISFPTAITMIVIASLWTLLAALANNQK